MSRLTTGWVVVVLSVTPLVVVLVVVLDPVAVVVVVVVEVEDDCKELLTRHINMVSNRVYCLLCDRTTKLPSLSLFLFLIMLSSLLRLRARH